MRRTAATMVLVLTLGAAALAAKPHTSGEVDPVAIASVLVAEGRFAQAGVVLDELEKVPKADRIQYYKLRGMIGLNLEQWADAATAFDQALEDGAEPIAHVFSAQAKLQLKDYTGCLASLDLAGEAGEALPGYWQLRSAAYRSLERPDEAYQTLLEGREQHPTHQGLVDDQLRLLVERGLTRAALDIARETLPKVQAKADTWVGLGDQLRRNGALPEAITWLEETRLRFPASIDAKVALASACLQGEQPLCCGEMLQEAAAYDNKYASEAAECYRRAGVFDRALYLNGTVVDDTVKVRQRLGLLLEQQDFGLATSLGPRLSRLGVLRDDEQVAYALAYAHYEAGSYDEAERLISLIRDPRLFQQATKLREAMQADGSGSQP